jgi:hypothetical protein
MNVGRLRAIRKDDHYRRTHIKVSTVYAFGEQRVADSQVRVIATSLDD